MGVTPTVGIWEVDLSTMLTRAPSAQLAAILVIPMTRLNVIHALADTHSTMAHVSVSIVALS